MRIHPQLVRKATQTPNLVDFEISRLLPVELSWRGRGDKDRIKVPQPKRFGMLIRSPWFYPFYHRNSIEQALDRDGVFSHVSAC